MKLPDLLGRRPTRPILAGLLALACAVPLALAAPAVASTSSDVVVDLADERQTIRGFGGMNHPEWVGDLTASQREVAFGTGAGQLGFSVLRVFVNEDPAQWHRAVPTARRAVEAGALVFASPWNPPASMVETFTRGEQTDAKRLRHDKYDEYAQHLDDFVDFMADNGVDLYAISVQNEPDYAHDWTWWTPQEIRTFMVENAGTIGTRVMAPESFQYLKNLSDPILDDPAALASTDILGAHLYGTQYRDFPYPKFADKGGDTELWMTEVYYPNSDMTSGDRWPEALGVAEHMHHAMVDAEFQAYVWWYIRRGYGPMREDGTVSKRGEMMAHFARFVRPGAVRVDATANPRDGVLVSAYEQTDGSVVVVAVNSATAAVEQRFVVEGGAEPAGVSSWVSDATRSLATQPDGVVTDGAFRATLPAQSVTTFVTAPTGQAAAPAPSSSPVAAPAPTSGPTSVPSPGATSSARPTADDDTALPVAASAAPTSDGTGPTPARTDVAVAGADDGASEVLAATGGPGGTLALVTLALLLLGGAAVALRHRARASAARRPRAPRA